MNTKRRKDLGSVITKLEELDGMREEIREQLAAVRDEEQEALENMPERLQESDRGQQMQEYIDALDDALYELDNIDTESIIDTLWGVQKKEEA